MNGTQFPVPAANQSQMSLDICSSSWQAKAVSGIEIAATLLIFLVRTPLRLQSQSGQSTLYSAMAGLWYIIVGMGLGATITMLVGVYLNGLVVWALGLQSNRKLVRRGSGEKTRAASSFRIYVLNLALADLVLLLRTPLMLGYIAHCHSWPFGDGLCKPIMFLRSLGLYASAFLLCAVALERCLCMLKPLWTRLQRPSWAVPLGCGIIWLVAAILSAPYFFSADVKEKNGTYQCQESGQFHMGLFVTETIAGFILPLLVFLGSNLAVLLTIQQTILARPTCSTPSTDRRMTRMYNVLCIVMLFFLTCWVPYFVCRFMRELPEGPLNSSKKELLNWREDGTYISLYLVYIKSALNPVLYVFAGRGLGRAVKASFVSTIGRLFIDSRVHTDELI